MLLAHDFGEWKDPQHVPGVLESTTQLCYNMAQKQKGR